VTASGRALAQARGIEAYAFTLRVQRCPASIGAPRLTGSTPSCSNAPFLAGCNGERDHCKMVEIPTMKDEDGKRPNREHDSLIGERSRIVNGMKAALVRLGIRGFI
jgi:hypothetical protein